MAAGWTTRRSANTAAGRCSARCSRARLRAAWGGAPSRAGVAGWRRRLGVLRVLGDVLGTAGRQGPAVTVPCRMRRRPGAPVRGRPAARAGRWRPSLGATARAAARNCCPGGGTALGRLLGYVSRCNKYGGRAVVCELGECRRPWRSACLAALVAPVRQAARAASRRPGAGRASGRGRRRRRGCCSRWQRRQAGRCLVVVATLAQSILSPVTRAVCRMTCGEFY